MARASLFTGQRGELLNFIDRQLEKNHIEVTGSQGSWPLNQQLARAAQQDGDPRLSQAEAKLAIENLAAGKEPVHLPGGPGKMRFEVENDLDMGGWNGNRRDFFEPVIAQAAADSGVKVELEPIAGTLKPAGALSRFLGGSDRATYRIFATGTRDQVEQFFDAYHRQRMGWDNGGE